MLLHIGKQSTEILILLALDLCFKPHGFFIHPLFNDLIQTIKCSSADKEDIRSIDLNKLLMRMLAATLRRYIGDGAFQQFQQCLLNTFAGNIASYGSVLTFTGDLIKLIDIDNALFRTFHIKISCLQELKENILHVFTDISGLRQGSGICNCKRHIQHLGEGLGKQCFTAAGRTNQKDIGLLQFNIIFMIVENALVMIVYRHRKDNLCLFLADNIIVQTFADIHRFRQFVKTDRFSVCAFQCRFISFLNDAGTETHALITDIGTIAGDQPVDKRLRFAAK